MKTGYHRIIAIGIVGIALVTGVVLVNANYIKPAEASATTSSAITTSASQIHSNQLTLNDWNLTVTKTTLGNVASDSTKKMASIYINVNGNAGLDKSFTPNGKIIGVVGSSGREYEINWLDSLDTMYTKGQRTVQMVDKQEGKTYQPGLFKFVTQLYVDAGEQNLTKLIYQDQNGNRLEIPIQLVPETPVSIPGGR